mgnify:CR=1 FL=1
MRVKPSWPYSSVTLVGVCVMRLTAPSYVQSNKMLVVSQRMRGLCCGSEVTKPSAACRPAGDDSAPTKEAAQAIPAAAAAPHVPLNLRSRHLLGIDGLEADEITLILDTAEAMKEIGTRSVKKVPTLRGRTVVNLFFEPSTRTRTSFEVAEKRLSADTLSIATATSSVIAPLRTHRSLSAMTELSKTMEMGTIPDKMFLDDIPAIGLPRPLSRATVRHRAVDRGMTRRGGCG